MTVYLDHNATTPIDERVLEAMLPYLGARFGNPSGRYRGGREARAALDRAREQVAALVGARPSQVVFTSGGTEANNLAIKGMARSGLRHLAVGATEHASVLGPAQALKRAGCPLRLMAVDSTGRLEPGELEAALAAGAELISVMMANNETGVVQDIAALGEDIRAAGAVLHTDAVQAVGKIPVDFAASGAQMLTLSAHKINGPKGAGALVVDRALDLQPLLDGGRQERGLRPGTENVAAIVGLGRAAELAAQELQDRQRRLTGLRQRLEAGLAALSGVVIFGAQAPRVTNTSFFGLPGIDGETLLMSLDGAGIAVSSGSACESGSGEPSHVLLAMGVEENLARGAVRVSLGTGNTEADVDALLGALQQQIQILRSMPAVAPV